MYFICVSDFIRWKKVPTNELQNALNMFYRQEGFKRYIEPKERNQVTKVITVYCYPPVDIRLICINPLDS